MFPLNYFQNPGLRHAWKKLYFSELYPQTPYPREQSQHVNRDLQSKANHDGKKLTGGGEKADLKFMNGRKNYLSKENLQNYLTEFKAQAYPRG